MSLLTVVAASAGCGSNTSPIDLGTEDSASADLAVNDLGFEDAFTPDAGPMMTACASNVDCAGGEVCRLGFCRTSCATEGDCPAGFPVCDVEVSYCVGCTVDEHCAFNEACLESTCSFFCRENTACAAEEYCVTETGACADRECEQSNQCPGGFRCEAFLCVPIDDIVCVAESVLCSGDNAVALRCNADGTMQAMEACDVGERCVASAGEVTCAPIVCAANEIGCVDGATAFVCDETGTVRSDMACGSGRFCAAGVCEDQICTPSSATCDGAGVVTCDALGSSESFAACSTQASCSASDFGCSCSAGACQQRVCIAGSTRCALSGFQTCAADGLSWGSTASCPMDETCVTAVGACAPILCVADSRECLLDVLVECDATGTVRTTTNCVDGNQICTGTGATAACSPRVCSPGSLACNGAQDSVLECDARGATLSSTLCPADTFCNAGRCDPQLCTPGSVSRCLLGDVRTCNTVGDAYTLVTDCTSSQTCVEDTAGAECRNHVCSPSAVLCVGDELRSCSADGLTLSTTDCQGIMSYCSSSTCQPWVCEPNSSTCTGTGAGATLATCNARGSALSQLACGGVLGCDVGGTACAVGCGDGNVASGEECDDGNAVDGDACSNACVANVIERRLAEPVVLLVDTVKGVGMAAAADVDRDGDLDLAVGYDQAPAQLFRNTGGALSAIWTESPGGLCGQVAWGDPNGDEWPDLAVGHCDTSGGTGFAHVFMNGSGTLGTTAAWTSAMNLWTVGLSWLDWDTDGDDDLAIGTLTNLGGASRVHRWTNGALEAAPGWTDPNLRRIADFAWGDVSGDGLNDMAFAAAAQAGGSGAGGAYVVRYGTPPVQMFGVATADHVLAVALFDLDGDGDLDLAFSLGSTLHLHVNSAGSLAVSSTTISLPAVGRGQGLAPLDFDGDGDTDLAVGTTSGIVVYENIGGSLTSSPRWTTANTGTTAFVSVVDWNNDGWPDLLASDTTLGVRVYLNVAAP